MYMLRYEGFVENPTSRIQSIVKFIGSSEARSAINNACRGVSTSSVGQSDIEMSKYYIDILDPVPRRFGYID